MKTLLINNPNLGLLKKKMEKTTETPKEAVRLFYF